MPAARVVRIASAVEWGASPALDLFARLGPVPHDDDHIHRVVVLRGARDHLIAVLAAGPIQISDVESADILPLPAAFAATAREISAIIVARDASLSLVLDPLAIAATDAVLVRNHA
ncbi:MAG TPA: chemotaxis protein CheW [Kofleriaceae bacterium]|nr:chemotaxis protein CheW [Kofleriaceae bacterium]